MNFGFFVQSDQTAGRSTYESSLCDLSRITASDHVTLLEWVAETGRVHVIASSTEQGDLGNLESIANQILNKPSLVDPREICRQVRRGKNCILVHFVENMADSRAEKSKKALLVLERSAEYRSYNRDELAMIEAFAFEIARISMNSPSELFRKAS